MLFQPSYCEKLLRKLKNAKTKVHAELQSRNIDESKLEENKSFSMPPQEIESLLSREPENLSENLSKIPKENFQK